MGYVTVNEIVKSALIDIGENSEHLYQRFLHWVLEGLKDFHYDSAKEIKTVSIEMNPTKTIDFPSDYVDWTKIGIVYGDRVFTFAVNHNFIGTQETDECGNPVAKPTHNFYSNSSFEYYGYGGYWFYNYSGHSLYSIGGVSHNAGYYSINKNNGQIEFSSEVNTSTIYLEYITNGINLTGESVVNEYASKLLKLYALWIRKENSNKYNLAEKERARTLYYNELRIVRSRLSNFDIQDFILASQKGYLRRTRATPYLQKSNSSQVDLLEQADDCKDVFPDTIPKEPQTAFKRYWGISVNPDIAGSGMTSQLILLLQSEYAESRDLDKTLDASGGRYLYFAYPETWGQGQFIFNTFPTSFLETTVPFTDEYGETMNYYLYRSLNLQHGSNLTIQIT